MLATRANAVGRHGVLNIANNVRNSQDKFMRIAYQRGVPQTYAQDFLSTSVEVTADTAVRESVYQNPHFQKFVDRRTASIAAEASVGHQPTIEGCSPDTRRLPQHILNRVPSQSTFGEPGRLFCAQCAQTIPFGQLNGYEVKGNEAEEHSAGCVGVPPMSWQVKNAAESVSHFAMRWFTTVMLMAEAVAAKVPNAIAAIMKDVAKMFDACMRAVQLYEFGGARHS